MKLTEIEADNKLIFRFKFKNKPYSMVVKVITKSEQCLMIPAILNRNQVLDPSGLTDVEIIFTVKDGVFIYKDVKLETSIIMEKNVYLVFSEEDVARLNRREAYRVFIGEILDITVLARNGQRNVYNGILKDMSTLGMGVILKNEIEIGSTLQVVYQYEGLNINLVGEVNRKERMNRYRAFIYGVKFREPNNNVFRVIILKQVKNKSDKSTML